MATAFSDDKSRLLYFLRRWDYSAAVANAFCQLLLERQLLFWPQNYFISYPNQMIFVPKPYKTRCLQSRIQLEFASFRNVLITSLPGSNEASGAVSPVCFLGTLYNKSMMIDLDIEYLPYIFDPAIRKTLLQMLAGHI